ncbi:hypothetical protein DTW90_36110 [Neorhizobium sp. P12A]|uniref:hypothetical protein n=1 Tax=Neorhizobium sp. P12A TaxID=2268027 RepID=UPI0011F03AA7|nr:hypothetical protein [Neorhizobium sp. P12A]KAA0684566.1 hypothetical protein DTW90_36110 [Neorhizobium sp. P12A]
MTCNCIETVNEKLATRNTRLVLPIVFRPVGSPDMPDKVMVCTEQVEKGRGKEKAVGMFSTYCPFRGVKYAEDVA